MGSEPIVSTRPVTHAAVIACGAAGAAAVAGGVAAAMGGPFAWSALLVLVTAVPAMMPALLAERVIASRYGSMVFFGMTGQMFLTLGAALFVRVAADVPMKPFLGGVAAGAGVLLSVQVAIAVWTLNRAVPAGEMPVSDRPAMDSEGDMDA